ncbi:wax ester/triacylglycerol synthase family O-acyltransferase [Conexibacter sp. SYSU D00693]|uniref:WS/DGAT/MGAT family O-acyltransferase n=1 Tax=Conexibacter sp. SYSU D00693 TaxID=2812560 RepID=UPI00196AD7A2|nr:wax ester/triacylglycerol synthase family O-acyltransferase [Conexibacter sp. SYSU D00693]
MRQLTSLDAQFLAMEGPTTYGHVSGLAVYDPSTAPGGRLEVGDVCHLVGERLHLLEPFRWKLAEVPFGLDDPYWVEDEDFDLDFHIRESAVPPPGDDRKLAQVVQRICARPLDRSRPLWEIYVIHGLQGGRVALLTKIHHAAVDGMSGAEVLSALLDLEPEGRELPPKPDRWGEPKPGQLEMLGRGLLAAPRHPVRALRALPRAAANLEDLPAAGALPGVRQAGRAVTRFRRALPGAPELELLDSEATRAPKTRFNDRITPHRRFAMRSISLERVKAVKNAMGVKVNDVVMAMCASAVRELLIDLGELPEEPLVAMVPLSVRTDEQMGTYGNRISAMFVPLPTDVDGAEERLLAAHRSMSGAKDRHRAVPADILQDVTRTLPPAVFARATRLTTRLGALGRLRPCNLVISNVPGPPIPLYCAGARLEAHFPVSVITDGVGLNITCMSYRDHIDFGIVVDRDQLDDPWPLVDALEHALEDLEVAAGITTREGDPAPPPPVSVP